MAASLDELVLKDFRVDAEGFRNLDSIMRQRCDEADSDLHVEYDVQRADSLRYTTRDIEDLIRERNGRETRIRTVAARIAGEKSSDLKFEVEFEVNACINGESDDRAKLVLLASDVRSLLREQMRSRRSISSTLRTTLLVAVFFVGYFGSTFYGDQVSNSYYSKNNFHATQAYRIQDKRIQGAEAFMQQVASKYRNEIQKRNSAAEQRFLVEAELAQLQYYIVLQSGSSHGQSAPYVDPPWWTGSTLFDFAIGVVLSAIVWVLSNLFYPPAGAIFLIGDEVQRQARKARFRERLVWGIGVTFMLGIASALAATAIHL